MPVTPVSQRKVLKVRSRVVNWSGSTFTSNDPVVCEADLHACHSWFHLMGEKVVMKPKRLQHFHEIHRSFTKGKDSTHP